GAGPVLSFASTRSASSHAASPNSEPADNSIGPVASPLSNRRRSRNTASGVAALSGSSQSRTRLISMDTSLPLDGAPAPPSPRGPPSDGSHIKLWLRPDKSTRGHNAARAWVRGLSAGGGRRLGQPRHRAIGDRPVQHGR